LCRRRQPTRQPAPARPRPTTGPGDGFAPDIVPDVVPDMAAVRADSPRVATSGQFQKGCGMN
jgi:hypothetical protein